MFFFFFKQKTAYEMRISDWSSDVCSSDLFLDRRRSSGHPPMEGKPDRQECMAIVEHGLGRPLQAIDYFEIMGGVRMSLVVARTIDRLKPSGAFPTPTNAALGTPIAGLPARILRLPDTSSGADFIQFVATASPPYNT